jgi:hypothetical protein
MFFVRLLLGLWDAWRGRPEPVAADWSEEPDTPLGEGRP